MKRIAAMFLTLILLFTSVLGTAQARDSAAITVQLNGRKIALDVPPMTRDGKVLVPAKGVFEAMGAVVIWNASTQTITSAFNDDIVIMTAGSKTMTKNDKRMTFDVAPVVVSGKLLVQTSAVIFAFGAEVKWDRFSQTVSITTDGGASVGSGSSTGGTSDGGEWYYGSDDINGLYRVKIDGTAFQTISSDFATRYSYSPICVDGDWVYFNRYDYSQNGVSYTNVGIFKIKVDGTGRMLLGSNYIEHVVDGVVYSSVEDGQSMRITPGVNGYYSPKTIYAMSKDGTSKRTLAIDSVINMKIVGDWIYYSFWDREEYSSEWLPDVTQIRKVKTDGTQKKILTADKAYILYADDDWVYYRNFDDNEYAYKVKTDGTGRAKLLSSSINIIGVSKEWVYYLKNDDSSGIYKCTTSGKFETQIVSDNGRFAKIIGDYVVYVNQYDNDNVYKIKTDGTGRQVLTSFTGERNSTTSSNNTNPTNTTTEQTKCAVCKGAGTVECFLCHGTGSVLSGSFGLGGYVGTTTCSKCGGSGKTTCSGCNGSGHR